MVYGYDLTLCCGACGVGVYPVPLYIKYLLL